MAFFKIGHNQQKFKIRQSRNKTRIHKTIANFSTKTVCLLTASAPFISRKMQNSQSPMTTPGRALSLESRRPCYPAYLFFDTKNELTVTGSTWSWSPIKLHVCAPISRTKKNAIAWDLRFQAVVVSVVRFWCDPPRHPPRCCRCLLEKCVCYHAN